MRFDSIQTAMKCKYCKISVYLKLGNLWRQKMRKLVSFLLVSFLSISVAVACPCDNARQQTEIKDKIALAEKVFQLEPNTENLKKLTDLKQQLAKLEEEAARNNA